jgi:uncharacterized protein (TIGR03000 family)
MNRLLCVMVAGVLVSSVSADNTMVSYATPLANYPTGGPPIVHPVYSYLAVPYYTVPAPYGYSIGHQTPVGQSIATRALPSDGYLMFGYGYNLPVNVNVPNYGFGYATGNSHPYAPGFGGVGFAFSMPSNPNIPTYAFGMSTGYASQYAIGFDGTTPTAAFVAPPLENQLTSVSQSYSAPSMTDQLLADGTAKITMTVPFDADVFIQGEKMQQTGSSRTFVTTAIYGPTTYEIKVVRKVDGKDIEQTTSVTVQPGQQSSVMVLR